MLTPEQTIWSSKRPISRSQQVELGFWSKYGPQTDPKRAPTECHNCSVRVWPYEEPVQIWDRKDLTAILVTTISSHHNSSHHNSGYHIRATTIRATTIRATTGSSVR